MLKNGVRIPQVAIVMASGNDHQIMRAAGHWLVRHGIPCRYDRLSVHRHPDEVRAYARSVTEGFINVVIAGSGDMHLASSLVAHLDGYPPVIGVPLSTMGSRDWAHPSFIPPGMPLVIVGVDEAERAAIFAAQILAVKDDVLKEVLRAERETLTAQSDERAGVIEAFNRQLWNELADPPLPK